MLKLFSFILELMRLCVLLVLTLVILGGLERILYQLLFGSPIYYGTMGLGNFLLFFVLYRNYFQFKGWYKSEKNVKLSRNLTRSLIAISFVLILIPIGIGQNPN